MYRLRDNGFKAYLVGGSVRDLLIGRAPKDFDLATNATPAEIKRLFRNCRLVGRRFRLAHLHFKNEIIEVATFRKGGEQVGLDDSRFSEDEQDSAVHLQKSDEGVLLRDNLFGTPEEDAWRRDFTVNALVYDIADFSIIDYTGGLEDLDKRLIRTIGDPAARFTEDPVRMIRAVRLSAQLGFSIEYHSWEGIMQEHQRITLASPARLFDELVKTLLSGSASAALALLTASGILAVLLPEFHEWSTKNSRNIPEDTASWIDAELLAGKAVTPAALLAVLFGEYVLETAQKISPRGTAYQPGIDATVTTLITDMSPRIFIPQRIVMRLREILLLQQRMLKIPGRKPENVAARAAFKEALAIMSFRSQENRSLGKILHWWKRFEDVGNSAPTDDQSAAPRSRKKRRRRRTLKRNDSPGGT